MEKHDDQYDDDGDGDPRHAVEVSGVVVAGPCEVDQEGHEHDDEEPPYHGEPHPYLGPIIE